MTPEPVTATPRLALTLTAIAALGVGAAWLVAWVMGASPAAAKEAAVAVAIAAPLGLAPALLRVGMEHWGLVVLLAGMVRGLLILALAFMATRDPEVPARAVGLGAAAGAVFILIGETITAVNVLSRAVRPSTSNDNAAPAPGPAVERPGSC